MSASHDDHGHTGHDAPAAHGTPGSPAGIAAHTSMELPPAPAVREISPARAEYAQPWPGRLLLWPIVWLGVTALFFVAARRSTGPVRQHEAAESDGDHERKGAPDEMPGAHERPVEHR